MTYQQRGTHGESFAHHFNTQEISGACLLTDNDARKDSTPVLGCGKKQSEKPSGAQNYDIQLRNELMKSENRIAEMLNRTLQGLAEAIRPPPRTYKPILPRFEGSEWENPVDFLNAIQRYCIAEGFHPDQWEAVAADQLRGDAGRWYDNFKNLYLNFEAFQQRLLEKYDNIAVRSRLQANLYGVSQGKEDVAVFISKKLTLFRRLAPHIQEDIVVHQIRELLAPEIRMGLRAAYIPDVASLTQLAAALENDLKEMKCVVQPISNSNRNNNRNDNNVNRNNTNERQIVRYNANTAGETQNNRKPLYPCRYCGGDHFNRECPARAIEPAPSTAPVTSNIRRQNQTQGNAQGVAMASTSAMPSTSATPSRPNY